MPWPQSKLYFLVALFTLGGISSFYIAETLPLLLPFFACYFLLVLTLHLLIKGKKTLTSGLVYLGYNFFGLVYFQSYYTLPQSHYSKLNSSSQKAIKKIVLENFYNAGQMRLLVLDSLQPYALKKLNPTHILLRNNPRINVDRLLSIYRPKYLISDGSNFPWNAARWKVSCEEKGILFYNTREKGAFKINLETEE